MRPYPGGLTYSGHVLACAAAVATINTMEEEGIVEQSARTGAELLGPGLRALAEQHPSVGEVRGLGTFWALELVRDAETGEPLVPYNASGADNAPMAAFAAACKKGGLWPLVMRQPHPRRAAVQRLGAGRDEGLGDPRRGVVGRGRAHGLTCANSPVAVGSPKAWVRVFG